MGDYMESFLSYHLQMSPYGFRDVSQIELKLVKSAFKI